MTDLNGADRSPEGATEVAADLSPFELLTPLVRQWKIVLSIPLVCGMLSAVASLVLPTTYTARTTFTPDVGVGSWSSNPSGLGSLVRQIGVPGLNGGSASPDFFAEVLKSRELLEATLLSSFRDHQAERPESSHVLLDLLDVSGETREERINAGFRLLAKRVKTRVDKRTGIVTLSVEGRPAGLVADLANRMVELLNEFNLQRRQSQSREQRRFTGERLAEAERELRDAEAQQLRFLQSNRRYADSPLLAFEANRLERQVQLRQEVFVTLSREYEEARIAEVRDTPVLTIIDPASPPDRRTFPRRKPIVLFAIAVGGIVAISLVFIRNYRQAAELRADDEYRIFKQAWEMAKVEMRALLLRRKSN